MYNENEKREINDEMNINKDKIIHCEYCKRIKKIVKVYDNNILTLENLI